MCEYSEYPSVSTQSSHVAPFGLSSSSHTHTHTYTLSHTRAHARTCLHAHTRKHTHTHAGTHIHTRARTHTHACTHKHTHACSHTHAGVLGSSLSGMRWRHVSAARWRTERTSSSRATGTSPGADVAEPSPVADVDEPSPGADVHAVVEWVWTGCAEAREPRRATDRLSRAALPHRPMPTVSPLCSQDAPRARGEAARGGGERAEARRQPRPRGGTPVHALAWDLSHRPGRPRRLLGSVPEPT